MVPSLWTFNPIVQIICVCECDCTAITHSMFPQHRKQCSRYKHSHIRNIGAQVIAYETPSRVVNNCECLLTQSVLKNVPKVKHSHSSVSLFTGCCSHVSTTVLLTVYGRVYVMHQWDEGVQGQKLNESSIRIHYLWIIISFHPPLWRTLHSLDRPVDNVQISLN